MRTYNDPSEVPQVRQTLGMMLISIVSLFMPAIMMAMGALVVRDRALMNASVIMFVTALVVTSVIALVLVIVDKRNERLEAAAA